MNFAQYDDGSGAAAAGFGIGTFLFLILIYVIVGLGLYKMFEKAGKPGWAGFIPIYNYYVALQIVGRPVWWLILFIIPLVNIVVLLLLSLDLAKSYGKGAGYGIAIWLLPFIMLPVLGFSDAQYVGPANPPAT